MLQEQHHYVKNNTMPKKISNIDTQKELPYGSSLMLSQHLLECLPGYAERLFRVVFGANRSVVF